MVVGLSPTRGSQFSWKMTASGELCCVALPFCCVVMLPCLSQHLLNWLFMYVTHIHTHQTVLGELCCAVLCCIALPFSASLKVIILHTHTHTHTPDQCMCIWRTTLQGMLVYNQWLNYWGTTWRVCWWWGTLTNHSHHISPHASLSILSCSSSSPSTSTTCSSIGGAVATACFNCVIWNQETLKHS